MKTITIIKAINKCVEGIKGKMYQKTYPHKYIELADKQVAMLLCGMAILSADEESVANFVIQLNAHVADFTYIARSLSRSSMYHTTVKGKLTEIADELGGLQLKVINLNLKGDERNK